MDVEANMIGRIVNEPTSEFSHVAPIPSLLACRNGYDLLERSGFYL